MGCGAGNLRRMVFLLVDAGSPRNSLPHRKNFVTGARAAVKLNPLAVRMSGAEGERHLLRILSLYSSYYNQTRTHLALSKDAPLGRAVQGSGAIVATRILFGLHHRYARI